MYVHFLMFNDTLKSFPFTFSCFYSVTYCFPISQQPVHYDHDRLVDLAFNPLISSVDQYLTYSDDVDPDVHFNINNCCDYFNKDKVNNILSNEG